MKSQKFRETVNEVICKVLEQTAFIFPEPADLSDGLNLDDFEMLEATVSFGGEREGTLELIVPVEFCRELASNILGEDIAEAESEEKHVDAAKEIVNIIAGQLLPRLYGEKALFNLTPPQTRQLSKEEFFSAIDQKEYACSMADDYPIIVVFTLGKAADERQSTRC